MKWIWKLFAAILIWVAAGLILVFVGGLLITVVNAQIQSVGRFLKDNAYLLGFLVGAWFLIWGKFPAIHPE